MTTSSKLINPLIPSGHIGGHCSLELSNYLSPCGIYCELPQTLAKDTVIVSEYISSKIKLNFSFYFGGKIVFIFIIASMDDIFQNHSSD